MSRSAEITLAFGDGEHAFRLAIGQLRELQEKCDAGPPLILKRLHEASWRVEDVSETIRLGLIGGGMDAIKALSLTARYVHERPAWAYNSQVASAVLGAALFGAEDEDEPEKPEAGAETPTPSRETSSDSD